MVKMGAVGHSGHTNIADYRHGVLVGNWYEDEENKSKAESHLLGFGTPFATEPPASAAAQRPEGRAGAELAASYARTDLTRSGACVPAALKFSHGDPHEPRVNCFATVNQLAFGEKCPGEPAVQQYLWSGKTRLNASVPISSSIAGPGLATRHAAAAAAAGSTLSQADRYTTTSQAVSVAAALEAAAAGGAAAASRAPAAGVGGLQSARAPVGRKPVGPFAAELDKNYLNMRLRKP